MLKKYLKSYGYLFGLMIIFTFILSIFNYFISFNPNILKIIIPILAMFIASIILGKDSREKAYIEGIKFSFIYLVLISFLKLIIKTNFDYKTIIIYLALILSSAIGAMLGINLKKE